MDTSNTALARAGWRALPGGLSAELPASRWRGALMLVAVAAGVAWFVRFLSHIEGPKPVLIVVEVSIVLIGLAWGGVSRLGAKTTVAFDGGVFRCVSESPRASLELPIVDLEGFEVEQGGEPHVLARGKGPSLRLPLDLGGAGVEAVARARAAALELDAMRTRASAAGAPTTADS